MHDRSPTPRIAALLGYGGLVPFLAAAVLAWPEALDGATVARIFVAYAATILAFLGGLQWGIALLAEGDRFGERLAVGVVPALIGWIALLLPTSAAVLLLAAAFAALFAWERLHPASVLPHWYWALRLRLSAVVVACHLVVAAAIA